jgi:hypothetical protein
MPAVLFDDVVAKYGYDIAVVILSIFVGRLCSLKKLGNIIHLPHYIMKDTVHP